MSLGSGIQREREGREKRRNETCAGYLVKEFLKWRVNDHKACTSVEADSCGDNSQCALK